MCLYKKKFIFFPFFSNSLSSNIWLGYDRWHCKLKNFLLMVILFSPCLSLYYESCTIVLIWNWKNKNIIIRERKICFRKNKIKKNRNAKKKVWTWQIKKSFQKRCNCVERNCFVTDFLLCCKAEGKVSQCDQRRTKRKYAMLKRWFYVSL